MTVPGQTMRAAFIREFGGPDAITVGELPVPQPGPTDVLVRFEASAADHVDAYIRSGGYRTPLPFPFVIGRDLVGTVAQAGVGAPGFAVGDRVWTNSLGHGGRQGAWSELAVVATDRLYRLPDGVSPVDAAPHLHTAATAIIGLTREAGLRPGETVLVGGGAGGVGSAAVQLAAAMGATVIATASAADAAWCRDLGASAVIDHHAEDMYAQIAAAAPDGVDVWWDTSGHHDFAATLPLLHHGARVIIAAALRAEPVLPVGALYTRDARLSGFAISNASVSDLADAARVLNRLLAAGRLQTRVGATFRLAEAAGAHEALESGRVRGRIVVVP